MTHSTNWIHRHLTTTLVFVLCLAGSENISAAPNGSEKYDPSLFNTMEWRSIGPYRGGRSVAVAGVSSQPNVYYFGGTGGGVWKTTDAGQSWKPISDKQFKTGSVGAITVAESDPNIIYVGMGEACVRGNFSHGDGVYKSMDAGETWENIGLRDSRQIGRIRVHPKNPDLIYVAVLGHIYGTGKERGVYRSEDGGKTWQNILFIDEKTGAVDIAMDVTNPRVLYAGMWQVSRTPWSLESGGPGSGLYKTTDGGETWQELTNGLPKGIMGRIGVAVSPVNPKRVWAIIEADEGGIFRSDDAGKSWKRINEDRSYRQRAWYYTHIYADTESEETVYVLNTGFYKSTDVGKTYKRYSTPHGDNHDLWISPVNSQFMINGNDGGANVSLNGGESWTRQDNQPTAQFYHVTTDNGFPYRVYGAQQDNSTMSIASRTTGWGIGRADWYPVGGCESGYIAPHKEDPNIVFAGCYGGYLSKYDHRTRQVRNVMVWPENPMGWGVAELKYRFQWTFPIFFSPHNPDVLYAAGNVLFKSTNEGESWEAISPDLTTNDKSKQGPSGGPITHDNTSVEYYCTIFSAVESPHEPGVIWAGSDDGLVHITKDGGENWNDVTPRAMKDFSLVSMIEVSPHDPAAAYLAVNRYKWDDFAPYIYKTNNYGKSWKLISKGIAPEAFVRSVREDPKREGLLYAGTETGVYVSFDDGKNWHFLQLNLPVVPITDLVVKEDDLIVATQGRSFWILDDLTPLHQMNDKIAGSDVHLYKPRQAYRMRGGRSRSAPNVGQNPPNGVVIHYFLKEKPEETVSLEFLEADGTLIKSFSSEQKNKKEEPSFGSGEGQDTVSTNTGMNRFVWNMRYPDAEKVPKSVMWAGILAGPTTVPGEYKVRLQAGETEQTQTFSVLNDPRLAITQADYEEQFDFLMEIRDKVTEAHKAINTLRDVREQVKSMADRVKDDESTSAITDAAKTLDERLTAIEEELMQTKSKSRQDPLNFPIKDNNKLAALTGVVMSANARPTDQSYDVYELLADRIDRQLRLLDDVLRTDIPVFNALVREHDVPAVSIE